MRSAGISLLILGIGSAILPFLGLQFKLLMAFGDAAPYVGGGLAVLGAVLLGISFMDWNAAESSGARLSLTSSSKSPRVEEAPRLRLEAAGSTHEEREYNLQLVRPSPGYPIVEQMVIDLFLRHVDTAVFDFTSNAVTIQYQIDGIWHKMPTMNREPGDYMLATLKQLCGLDYRERRQRQEGSFKASYYEGRAKIKVVSQGVPAGERVGLYLDLKKSPLDNFEQLGMRAGMKQQLEGLLNARSGLLVVSAMPSEGYTTLWRATLGACDRFTRDHYLVEPQGRTEREVINFHSVPYDEAAGETPFTVIPQLLLREPHVTAFPELSDGALLNEICRLSSAVPMLTLTRIYSRHAIEGLPRLLAIKPDPRKLAENLQAILCMRLVRKLCETCKQGYQPAPQVLTKLGIPTQRIHNFFRPFPYQPGQLDSEGNEIPPCPHCLGIGYAGRTGVFELLILNDALRQAFLTNPKVDYLTQVAQAAGHISMRDEAILLVAKGTTSLEELQRVFAK